MKRQNLQHPTHPVLPFLRDAFLLTLSVFLLPGLLFLGPARAADTFTDTPSSTPSESTSATSSEEASSEPPSSSSKEQETKDATQENSSNKQEKQTPVPASAASSVTLTVLADGEVKTMELEEYLWGVVAAEMPAAFQQEALNAQAIAARTYTLYRMDSPSQNHPNANICTDSGCCQAWISYKERLKGWEKAKRTEYAKKITTAIQNTSGLALYYQDKPIMAAFHAASAGVTKSAKTVWGKDLPYLQSVSSPETKQQVPKYYSVVTVSEKQFSQTLCSAYPKLTLPDDPSTWFGKVTYDSGGLPYSIRIGNQTVPTAMLRTLFNLRSASITAEWDGKQVRFYVTGYGHGVGMSQYGANAMAKQGKTAEEILCHYYTGIKIHKIQ